MQIGVSNPNETYTLNQFIALKDSDSITYQKYSVLNRSITNENIVYSIDNIIYNYMDEIMERRKICTFTKEEQLKYMYKPKLLSYDIYNSSETYFIILAMNGMCNAKEFDLAEMKLNLLMPTDMANYMSQIANVEKEFINLNRTTQGVR